MINLLSLWFLGSLGAVVTVYLGKRSAVPDFPLFESEAKEEKEQEVSRRKKRNETIEREIDSLQEELKIPSMSEERANRLEMVIDMSMRELEMNRERMLSIEDELKHEQLLSRSLGFLVFIALGGVFGALLSGRIQVEGLSGDLPDYFESIIIGATWTTYLSTIGIGASQRKAEDRVDNLGNSALKQLNTILQKIPNTVARELAKAETAEKTDVPQEADKISGQLEVQLEQMRSELEDDISFTKQMVQRDFRRIL